MTSPLHAAYYADHALQQTVEIVENVRLARDTYRLRFSAPEIARRIVPGQFLMLRLAGINDPLIGRPLALYDTVLSASGRPECIDVVYLVKGKLTSRLLQMPPGQQLDVWGPLGNGFQDSIAGSKPAPGEQPNRTPSVLPPLRDQVSSRLIEPAPHLIMVAGGIGQTPFLALAQEALGQKTFGDPPRAALRAAHITFCYGARTADYFAGVEDFERLGIDVRLATDDGSRGHHGLVTDLLKAVLAENRGRPRIVCCGPEAMMEAVAHIAHQACVPCQVSLETPMACGVGICFTCVAKIRQEKGGWDYKRTCVDGPVFDAEAMEW
ncbi:MAG TPA: dihydroorotate dehydrogenase electron transfer subunit [Pirellulaceae bacterium]|nr:dihydroorotate dehydrogenase electron transfer subunit [Pirellulaceae bacterium]